MSDDSDNIKINLQRAHNLYERLKKIGEHMENWEFLRARRELISAIIDAEEFYNSIQSESKQK